MKNIIITGGNKGIGRAIVEKLAKEILSEEYTAINTQLIFTYRSNEKQAQDLVATLAQLGVCAHAFAMNLSSRESIDEFYAKIMDQFGHVNSLIANAGMTNDGSFLAMPDEDVARLLHTNLSGTMYLTERLVSLLQKAKQSSVVVMASAAGVYGKEGQVPYATTKGGLIGYCQLLAKRFGRQGMYVNAVAPGFIETDMVTDLDPSMFEHTLNNASIGSMGTPEDVANVVHSLLTPGYIQATTIKVDGGHLR